MWKHKNFINLQLCAPPPITTTKNIYVNGVITGITVGSESSSAETWIGEQEFNTTKYTISGNTVVWSDGTILQYNGVDVLPTDNIVENGQYTTRTATQKLPTPTNVSISGTTVQWDEVANATSYDVLVDGEVWENVPQPSSGETWVLNESLNISRTTYYNNIEMSYSGMTRSYPIKSLKIYEYSDGPETACSIYGEEESEYKEGNAKYGLYCTGGGSSGWYHSQDGTDFNVWTFAMPPTGDLLTWLQANGTKQ